MYVAIILKTYKISVVDFQVSPIDIMLSKTFAALFNWLGVLWIHTIVLIVNQYRLTEAVGSFLALIFSNVHLLYIVLLLFIDDFEETTGIRRIIQALHAHTWSNLEMKGIKYSLYSNKLFVFSCLN